MEKLIVKIHRRPGVPLPSYATVGAAGMDVQACLEKDLTIEPMQRALVPTGFSLEMPPDYECQVRPRSGLALHYGITVLNTPGTIDADSRAEIGVILINLSREPFVVSHGDSICQLVFKKCEKVEWEDSEKLDQTARGEKSFGEAGPALMKDECPE